MANDKVIIAQFIETLKNKDIKLYNALKRMSDELNDVYEALFTGPLPSVSAEDLDFSKVDLTQFPQTQLPDTVAFENYANVFIQDQKIQKDDPLLDLLADTGIGHIRIKTTGNTGYTHLQGIGDSESLLGAGMKWDGANFITDGGDTVGLSLHHGGISFNFLQFIAGVLTSCLQILPAGQVTIGTLTNQVDMGSHDLGMRNATFIRGSNAASTHNHPMIGIDANDLIEIGSNPTGATTGEGNISIPRADAADLPVAGATRNGILILDKTANKFCYYVGGNRYAIAGVAF